MKYILMVLMTASIVFFVTESKAQESCDVISQDVNTPVPKELEDGEIIVRTKDGKEHKMNANDFKVVKRKQQYKVKEVTKPCETKYIVKEVMRESKSKENKNLVMIGARYDYVELDKSTTGNTTKLYSTKGPVLDLSYFRRQVLDTRLGLGVGLDTNAVLRGVAGFEF